MKVLVTIPYGRALLVPEKFAPHIADVVANSELVKEDGWGDNRKLLYPESPESVTLEFLPPAKAVVDAEIKIAGAPDTEEPLESSDL